MRSSTVSNARVQRLISPSSVKRFSSPSPIESGSTRCSDASMRAAPKARSGISGSFSGDTSLRIGSRHSPGTMFIAWNGDTSGGAPSSSK